MTNTNLKHITGDLIKQLASAAHCDESYVRKILNGERKKKSVTARKIWRAAEQLNTDIERSLSKQPFKELIIIGEND